MRKLNECFIFEVRQADGSWVRAHLEQIDIGDVARMVRQNGEVVTFQHSKNSAEKTSLMTFISQAAYRVVHGDFEDEVLQELKRRTQVMPGENDPMEGQAIVPPPSLIPEEAKR